MWGIDLSLFRVDPRGDPKRDRVILVFHAITPIAYLLFARNWQNATPNIHTMYKNGVNKVIVRGDILHSASHVQF